MMDRAFAEVVRDRGRDMGKPRSRGRTAVLDPGLSVEVQGSWLRMAAAYVDEAKIMTGTASLYTPEYLREKLAVYHEHRVRPFLGGFFFWNGCSPITASMALRVISTRRWRMDSVP